MAERDPQSRDEIVAALGALATDGLRFWSELDARVFASPIGDAWSPADNVRHLIKSTRPVVLALKLPRLPLRILFGSGTQTSRTYAALVADYRAILASGGTAGRYAPAPVAQPGDVAGWQSELVADCRSTVEKLERAAAGWDDRDLDRYRMPHPLLGKLTARELLFFTLYHFDHHAANVARRSSELSPTGQRSVSAGAAGTS